MNAVRMYFFFARVWHGEGGSFTIRTGVRRVIDRVSDRLFLRFSAIGCRSLDRVHDDPDCGQRRPAKLAPVAGRVTGARQGQRVVMFARSGDIWWVQPFRSRPFTAIEDGSTWKNSIHLGTEYAALP